MAQPWDIPPFLFAIPPPPPPPPPEPEIPPEMLLQLLGNRPPQPQPPPDPSRSLQAWLHGGMFGALNPLGLTPPPTTVMQSPGQTLTGQERPPTPRTLTFGSGNSEAELLGSLASGGPMLRLAGGGVRAARTALRDPRIATGLGAGGLSGLTMLGEPGELGAQRSPPPSDEVRALQRRLQDAGLYRGAIDGVMGPETERAATALQARETQAAAERARQTELDLQKATSDNERERIRLEREREERTRVEGDRANEVTREGMERFRNTRPSFMQEYGAYLGYPLGFAMGLGGRYGMSRVLNREAREMSTRAGDMGRTMGTGDVPERVGRVNEFWSLGAPNRPPPFSFQPGRQPFPWTTNAAAPPPGDLYRSGSALSTYGPGALTTGVGAGETGLGYAWLQNARHEMEAAQAALSAANGMTPANVQRLEDARNAVAQAEFLMRTGMGTLAGGTVGELESVITRGKLRPSTRGADAERGRLDQMLNPPGPAAPQPRWDAAMRRWRLNGGFVRGPRDGGQ